MVLRFSPYPFVKHISWYVIRYVRYVEECRWWIETVVHTFVGVCVRTDPTLFLNTYTLDLKYVQNILYFIRKIKSWKIFTFLL